MQWHFPLFNYRTGETKKNRYFLLRRNLNSLARHEIIATDGQIMDQKMRNRPTAHEEALVS
jgi:hypothetical protein